MWHVNNIALTDCNLFYGHDTNQLNISGKIVVARQIIDLTRIADLHLFFTPIKLANGSVHGIFVANTSLNSTHSKKLGFILAFSDFKLTLNRLLLCSKFNLNLRIEWPRKTFLNTILALTPQFSLI